MANCDPGGAGISPLAVLAAVLVFAAAACAHPQGAQFQVEREQLVDQVRAQSERVRAPGG